MAQWTMAQAQLATLSFPLIGSICGITDLGEPVIGKMSTAASDGFFPPGPFSTAIEFFTAAGKAALRRADVCDGTSSHLIRLGALVFLDIVQETELFRESQARYPLNHIDLGTHNILVDDNFNFLAIIDWEFAQTAPWQVNHYPMPFPLLWPDARIKGALDDPEHVAHVSMSRQAFARQLYSQKFRDAESVLRKEGRPLGPKFAEVLESPASRIYACFEEITESPEHDVVHVREMVRLAFGFDAAKTDRYLEKIS